MDAETTREVAVGLFKIFPSSLNLAKYDSIQELFDSFVLLYSRLFLEDQGKIFASLKQTLSLEALVLFVTRNAWTVNQDFIPRKFLFDFREFLIEHATPLFLECMINQPLVPETFQQNEPLMNNLLQCQEEWFYLLGKHHTHLSQFDFSPYFKSNCLRVLVSSLVTNFSEKSYQTMYSLLNFCYARELESPELFDLLDALASHVQAGASDPQGLVFKVLTLVLKKFPNKQKQMEKLLLFLAQKLEPGFEHLVSILECFEKILKNIARSRSQLANFNSLLYALWLRILKLMLMEKPEAGDINDEMTNGSSDIQDQELARKLCYGIARQYSQFLNVLDVFELVHDNI